MPNSNDPRRNTNSATLPRPVRSATPSPLNEKQQFLSVFAREHATTLKVMQAFPAQQGAFQPHPRSQSAKRLMWTFVMALDLVRASLDEDVQTPPGPAEEPATVAEVIAAYEEVAKAVASLVTRASDASLRRAIPFHTGPRQVTDMPLLEVMWLMLLDSIHHRGQLSVYVRMTGGMVPSIYGPSADEPWM